MNIIDIAFIVILVLFLLIGFFGKLVRQLIHLIMVLAAIPVGYLLSGALINTTLGAKIIEWISNIELIKSLVENSPSLESFITGSSRMVLFYALGIVLMILFSIIGEIIFACLKKNKSAGLKGVLALGLVKALSTLTVLVFVVLMPISIGRKALNEASNSDGIPMPKVVGTINTQVQSSKFVDTAVVLLDKDKVPFIKYKVIEDDKEVEYNFYTDLNDLSQLIPFAGDLKNLGSSLNLNMDVNDSTQIEESLDKIGEVLDRIDTLRSELGSDGHTKKIIAEIVEYFLTEYPKENESVKFLLNTEPYLEGFDYQNDGYKDKLVSVVLQAYIDSLEATNPFVKFVNVSTYTFAELKTEAVKLPDLMKIFKNQSNMTESEIANLLSTSKISKQVVTGLLDEYYTDDSVNEDSLNYNNEAKAISMSLAYANSDDNSLLDTALLVNALGDSDLLPAIIDFYNKNEEPIVINVTLVQKTALELGIDANTNMTSQQKATYKTLFVVE